LSGCIVIIYFPESNTQCHYLEHDKEVICLATSNSELVASSEIGDSPAIHIWDVNTFKNVSIIKGVHTKGVHLMSFMKNDEFIVTCGIRKESPIIIYNIKNA